MYLSHKKNASVSLIILLIFDETFSLSLESVILNSVHDLKWGDKKLTTVIQITGNVQHPITLDPSIWIFDDRRIDLDVFFTEGYVEKNEMEEYKKAMGKHWSREIMEGATFPPTLETEKLFEETKEITETYGIYLHHFLKNAGPHEDATTITFETNHGESHSFPLDKRDDFILKYSHEGKPLREDGPVHILLKDGSNRQEPIKNVIAVTIK